MLRSSDEVLENAGKMSWVSHPVFGERVVLTAEDATMRGLPVRISRELSPLELDELSYAYGNIEVGLTKNLDSGRFDVLFGQTSNEIKFKLRPGTEVLFHTHPGGSLIPSFEDTVMLKTMYELNSSMDHITETSRIVARFGGSSDELGWGVRVFEFDRKGNTMSHKVILRVLHD